MLPPGHYITSYIDRICVQQEMKMSKNILLLFTLIEIAHSSRWITMLDDFEMFKTLYNKTYIDAEEVIV